MCGIFAYIGSDEAPPRIIEGLEKLEYRGYDSAGIGVITVNKELKVIKTVGYVSKLNHQVFRQGRSLDGHLAIGHTRWATHGGVTKANAHPQLDCSAEIAVVHNGVIENFEELKKDLIKKGHKFRSETDTEVINHLIEEFLSRGLLFKEAFRKALASLVGAWAVAAISLSEPNILWLGRFSSPLAVGLAKGEVYVSSDAQAFPREVKKVIFLEDGQLAKVDINKKKPIEIFGLDGQKINYQLINKGLIDEVKLSKGKFRHFMLKEIYEQPKVIDRALRGRVDFKKRNIVLGGLSAVEKEILTKKFIGLMACGTSYHAAMIGRLFGIGALSLSVWLENSSDYSRYDLDKYHLNNSSIFYISQSGETSDTLSSLDLVQKNSTGLNLGIVNVVGSSLARRVEAGVYTRAGVEVGVASTKAFTSQILALLLAEIYINQLKGGDFKSQKTFFQNLAKLSSATAKVLKTAGEIEKIAKTLVKTENFMFLGRHIAYPLALEGALKLKEITYRFSYGDALGSLKHGPLALLSADNVVVAIVFSQDPDLNKSLSNIHEITARKGRLIVITDLKAKDLPQNIEAVIKLPQLNNLWLMPLVTAPVLQLLAYYLAVHLGREIDKPRYLAKSVTVI